MGYQESFIFVTNKADLVKLTRVFNKNFDEMSGFVNTHMACRFKKPINMQWPFESELYKKGYFLYWMGERHPIQNNHWLMEKIEETTYEFSSTPLVVPCENIAEVEDVFKDWKNWRKEDENSYQNDLVDILLLDPSRDIDIERVKGI